MSDWHVCDLSLSWLEPLAVANGLRGREGLLAMMASGVAATSHGGRWSYVGCEPCNRLQQDIASDSRAMFDALQDPHWRGVPLVALAAYDAGARPATGLRPLVWPDLLAARYRAMLVFDHLNGHLVARGWGETEEDARHQAARAARWCEGAQIPDMPPPPASAFDEDMSATTYCCAVAEVVDRIGRGELFQANIARGWSGVLNPDSDPFDVFVRLSLTGGAGYGAYWHLGERALVSNSPELFLSLDGATRRLEARPIKGTRPRGKDAGSDKAMAQELVGSVKDRAENLMIVDLMRNDLAHVCAVGTVKVDQLCGLESFATVHHLTSVVSGRLLDTAGQGDIMGACFPAGSITGAPKNQAMKVIAALEPPRGVWCGSLIASSVNHPDDMVASVLIRTASFTRTGDGWGWSAMAGAGITADSQPDEENAEAETKISALRYALAGGAVQAAHGHNLTRA